MNQEDINRLRAISEQACMISMSGTVIRIECNERSDAELLFDYLTDDIIAEAERAKLLEDALAEAVRINTENARLRDLYVHHLRNAVEALNGELADFEGFGEEELVGWLGEEMGRRVIGAQIVTISARTALEQKGTHTDIRARKESQG